MKSEGPRKGALGATNTNCTDSSIAAYGARLLDPHAAKLAASGVDPAVAAERGYRSADTKRALEALGFSAAQRNVPALVIPLWGVTGEIAGWQARPDEPRWLSGRALKYESPAGSRPVLDSHPRVRPLLDCPAVPLWITEGPIKADSAVSRGLACVAVAGVWAWRGRNDAGGTALLADFECVALNGRTVYIAFDSDVMSKPQVHDALARLSAVLSRRGAEVMYVYLPPGPGATKVGLDDYFAGGASVEDLVARATPELRRPPGVESEAPKRDLSHVPWEAGDDLLSEVDKFLAAYVAFPSDEARWAAATWGLHSWTTEWAESSPRLAIISPEKQSGKTRLLEALDLLCRDPLRSANVTPAALFRLLGERPRTLLLDEVDTIFGSKTASQHEDLRALLNAGHRPGATVGRCVGDGATISVVEFPVYGAAALAGIGDIPDTILDRSVVVRMRRRAPGESVRPFRLRQAEAEAAPLRERAEAWAARQGPLLADADPAMPAGLVDRPADVWAPLLAIADLVGGPWPARLRAAAERLVAEARAAAETLGERLLRDIRSAFDRRGDPDFLATSELLDALVADPEAPWASLRGRPLGPHRLARMLDNYGVGPQLHRAGTAVARGYLRADFLDPWARYLPPSPPTEDPPPPPPDRAAEALAAWAEAEDGARRVMPL